MLREKLFRPICFTCLIAVHCSSFGRDAIAHDGVLWLALIIHWRLHHHCPVRTCQSPNSIWHNIVLSSCFCILCIILACFPTLTTLSHYSCQPVTQAGSFYGWRANLDLILWDFRSLGGNLGQFILTLRRLRHPRSISLWWELLWAGLPSMSD